MNYEISKVRLQHEKVGLPIRDIPPARFERDEAAARRRSIRVATDGMIREGIMRQNLGEIAVGIAETMTASAGACLQFCVKPDVPDALTAAKELLEDARLVVDNSLTFSEPDQVRVGVCMLEIVCVGIAHCFGIPYKKVFDLAHNTYMDGKDLDREAVSKLLQEAIAPAPLAANEENLT